MDWTKLKAQAALAAFWLGVVLVLGGGFIADAHAANLKTALVLTGLVAALAHVTAEESAGFLLAAVALGLAGTVAADACAAVPWCGTWLAKALGSAVLFVAPGLVWHGGLKLWSILKD